VFLSVFAHFFLGGLVNADSSLARVLEEARPAWDEVKKVIEKQKKCELKLRSWLPADQVPDRFDETVLRHGNNFLGFYDNRVSQAEFILLTGDQAISGEKTYENNSWFLKGIKKYGSWGELQSANASKMHSFESPFFQSLLIEPGLLIDQLLDRNDFDWKVSEDGIGSVITLTGKWKFADTKEEKPAGTSYHRFVISLDRKNRFQIQDIRCTWGKKPTLDLYRKIEEWQSVGTALLPKRVSTNLTIDMNGLRTVNRSEVDVTFDDSIPPYNEFSLVRFGLAPVGMGNSWDYRIYLLFCIGISILAFSLWRRSRKTHGFIDIQ